MTVNNPTMTTNAAKGMRQEAPDPLALHNLVGRLRYKPGWRTWLDDIDRGQGSRGLTLVVQRTGPDAYHPDRDLLQVNHYFPVPPAAYDERSWRRWLFDRLLDVETHEAIEFFQLATGDGAATVRPLAPSHGPGNDPYMIREPDGTDLDRRTKFTGEVEPEREDPPAIGTGR